MISYRIINAGELKDIVDRGSYDSLRYVFEHDGIAPKILRWKGELEGKDKIFSYNGLVPLPIVMNTIYFNNENFLYGVVLPFGKHVDIKKLGKFLGMSGKQAKSELKMSEVYPANQTPGSLSPFISEKDENVVLFHSLLDNPRQFVDHSYPGRADISLVMRLEEGVELLERKYGYKRIKMIALEEIAK